MTEEQIRQTENVSDRDARTADAQALAVPDASRRMRRIEIFGTWLHDAQGNITAFVGSQCARCGEAFFPAVDVCLACGCPETSEVLVEPRGTLIEFTRVWRAPEGLPVPYFCGYVRLGDGIRIFAQIEAGDATLRPGMPMIAREAVVREEGGRSVIGYKFFVEVD